MEDGQEDLAEFLAAQGTRRRESAVYTSDNVDKQRGKGTFGASIDGLRRLNALGYGHPGTGLELDLVYNPGGAFLPPAQEALEVDYRERLGRDFDIVFSKLLTLANLPVNRFAQSLEKRGELKAYETLLKDNLTRQHSGLMSFVDRCLWDDCINCDFNQMLEMPLEGLENLSRSGRSTHGGCRWSEMLNGKALLWMYPGAGSSCGGALSAA